MSALKGCLSILTLSAVVWVVGLGRVISWGQFCALKELADTGGVFC